MNELEKYQQNARTTAALIDAGIDLMRENIRRRHPGIDPVQINTLLSTWLCRQQDPIPGDVAGLVHPRGLKSHP
ncbi:MAG: hypothetical protein WCO42_06045 [bacterium]